MSKSPILKNYVSELDQFLYAFDQSHPELSKSQQKEQATAKRVSTLRDNPTNIEPAKKFWKDF